MGLSLITLNGGLPHALFQHAFDLVQGIIDGTAELGIAQGTVNPVVLKGARRDLKHFHDLPGS